MAAPKRRTPAPKRRTAAPKRRRAPAKKRAARARKPLPPWLLLGSGLLLGIASVLGFNLAKEVEWDALRGEAPPSRTAPGSAAAPRFDFYTILPNQEVVVPDATPPAREKAKPSDKQKAGAVPGDVYYLQAGSFRKLNEANGMKARVILLGTRASIQTVAIDHDTWHRVRVGPYRDLAQLREVRARLRDNKIETLLIRAQE